MEYIRLNPSEKWLNGNGRATNKFENISLFIGGQLSKHNSVTYLNPFVTLRYLGFTYGSFSPVVSVSYNYRIVGGLMSNTVTPEIGININSILNLKYGYNIFLDNQFNWISNHRLALRLMLF